MSKIVFVSDKLKSISVRLKTNEINDLEKVAHNITTILGEEVSRNAVIEQMISSAKSTSTFELDGVSYTFEELLIYSEETIVHENNEESIKKLNSVDNEIKSLTAGPGEEW